MKSYFALFSSLLILSLGLPTYGFADDVDNEKMDDALTNTISDGNNEEPGCTASNDNNTENSDETGVISEEQTSDEVAKPEHVSAISPYAKGKIIQAKIQTSLGELSCELYAGDHPMTVLNFVSLATGKPAWTDASGKVHHDAYYKDLKFGQHTKNRFVVSGSRNEGTDFVIVDERCISHGMDEGAVAMVQPYPGMASAQFILLADKVPAFKGMYPVFGKCGPIDLIKEMTNKEVTLNQILIVDSK